MTKMAWLSLIAASAILVSAPSAQQPRASIVTIAGSGPTLWRHDDATRTFVKAWQSSPLFAAPGAQLYIGDYTGDGVNDLVVTDRYGITVYGSAPAYYPLPEVGLRDVQLVAADLDGDGSLEFITNRFAQNVADQVEIWRVAGGRLTRLGTVTEPHGRSTYVLELGDVDNDGLRNLVTASETITIFKPTAPMKWELAATLPFVGALADVVRVADVDGDGWNEILATGNSGMLTIYSYRRLSGRESYPVIWQSPMLRDRDLPKTPGPGWASLTQGLAVGDLNGDGKPEILVGTVEFGVFPDGTLPDGTRNRGHIHVFASDDWRGFAQTWRSDWTESAFIPAFSIGDLDGDGLNEFVYNAVDVYGYNRTKATYERRATLPTRSQPVAQQPSTSAIGVLPALDEPSRATRIVLAGALRRSLKPGERADISVSLRSVWARATDVMLEVTSTSPDIVVKSGVLRIGAIESGAVVASPTFAVEAQRPPPIDPDASSPVRYLILTITAAGGYRQSIPIRMGIEGS